MFSVTIEFLHALLWMIDYEIGKTLEFLWFFVYMLCLALEWHVLKELDLV
jgi:hypothetical protein